MKLKLMLKKQRELILYLIFGVLTTIIGLFSYYILTYTILNPNNPITLQIANIISWFLSVSFAYITNRKYVFRSNNRKIKEIPSFFAGRLLSLLLDLLIMGIGVSIMHFDHRLIKIISEIFVIAFNYIISKVIVFKKKEA